MLGADNVELYLLAYPLIYGASFVSVAAIFYSVYRRAHQFSVSLSPSRVLTLTKDEVGRLERVDPVFLMHLSIVLGIGISVAEILLAPVLPFVPVLGWVLLGLSLPVTAGLVAAFAWRVQRFAQSKAVEAGLHTAPSVSSASSKIQVVLMVAIALTASELVMAWFPALVLSVALVSVLRNSLVAVYYGPPTANLVANAGVPLPAIEPPFKLSDIVSGKADASSVKNGVGKYGDFLPKERLSFDSCVEIGVCEASCPATAAGRPLSPRLLVRKLRLHEGEARGDESPFSVIGEDELWACTSCGACVDSCPVSVKHLDLVYDLRRDLVARGKLDKEKSAMLENLARTQNPYGFKQSDRGAWTQGLGVPTIESKPDAEYVYWVGCVASFDQRAQRVAKSLVKILN